MCRYCKRVGATLISYPWPSPPIHIESLRFSMTKDERLLMEEWNQDLLNPPELIVDMDLTFFSVVEYSSLLASLDQFQKRLKNKSW